MESKKILVVNNVEVKFRVRSKLLTAIRGISFDLYEKEILAIVGESGSGKSVITKTFTGMLESNGWISEGSIIYIPNVDDKDFKSSIDVVNTQKQLIDKPTRKFILRNCKKKIRKMNSKINFINKSDLKEKLNDWDKMIIENEKTLKTLKEKNLFKNSWFINFKISKLEKNLKLIKYKNELKNEDFKNKELEKINTKINEEKSDYFKYKTLNIFERFTLNKITKIIKSKIKNNLEFTKQEDYFIEKYLVSKSDSVRFISQLKKIYFDLKKNVFEDKEHFLNIMQDWKKIKSFNFLNRRTSLKEVTKLRGKTIATIFQDPMTSLNPLLSVGFQISEVLRKHHKLSKREAKVEAIELLRKVGISEPEKRYKDIPGMYSGGMRQRVVIAIALACKPKILICDEPTTALDVTIQAQILQLIKDLQNEYNFSVVFITHDLGVVASIATRILVMYCGQIVEMGKTKEIFYDAKHPYTWALLLSLPQLGTKGENLYSIEGTPPSLFSKINGDAFAPRNKYALKIDYLYEPPIFKVSDTHLVKTWLLDERAPKLERPVALDNLHQFIKQQHGYGTENE
ncbi:oligopeptide ABC transporter ATP-binding protein OppD [Spiroplasma taiwanense]|uniref:Oligopeptide ABC transporter ATP-binding protein n=1 Tax=Spiroplasma taiwanense CT-1 TaxID=1276220 RepID=S5MHV3_9MOLU|nr:oligopeptide ABC transporter ATP-binding protein OppD [Spiroplasma taiwanense]AGR41465.1 oligopeptide ABC transporter ATP-binding protein [Spiroplasma taiwanense CT-1]